MTYNGENLTAFYPERTAAYVPQDDVHIAKLQAQETLDFSARVQGPGTLPGMHTTPLKHSHTHASACTTTVRYQLLVCQAPCLRSNRAASMSIDVHAAHSKGAHAVSWSFLSIHRPIFLSSLQDASRFLLMPIMQLGSVSFD